MTYQKNEKIEVLDHEGNWVIGRYMFPSDFSDDDFEPSPIQHVIECFDLDYCPIRIPDDKIRKIIKASSCDETAHYRCLG